MELLDELHAGVPAVGAPAIQRELGVSYEATAWALLLVPGLVGLVIEPVLFLLADRHPRGWFVRGGAVAMAIAAFAAAAAPSVYALCAAVSLSFAASGCSVATAQAILVDAHPHDRERVMTRWSMMGVVGDLAAPALAAALAAASVGWRTGYAIAGAAVAIWAIGLCRASFPAAAPGGGGAEPDAPLLASLWTALGNRRLMWWLFGASLCELLDEILVVFASLHLRDVHGAGEVTRALVLAGLVAGEAAGLAVADRLLRTRAPLPLLAAAGAACAAVYVAWVAAPSLWLAALLLVAVGVTSAPLYPITMAQAYAALPGRSGAVQAASHLFTPMAMSLPWLLGWLADRCGTGAALAALVAQPIALLLLAVATMRIDRRPAIQGEPGG